MLADRALTYFDRVRSLVVSSLASDAVLEAYNDLAYGTTTAYDANAPQFREALFNWEVEMVDRAFPNPPGRVLIGGAGGGREAFELCRRGYDVTAFEPSRTLARSMADRVEATGVAVQPLIGRYQDVPVLQTLDSRQVDLREMPRFDAAVLGWSSYSHIRSRAERTAALAGLAAVTDGPVFASFYSRRESGHASHALGQWTIRRGFRAEGDRFTPHVGFFHQSTFDEIDSEIQEAGLVRVALSTNDGDGSWPWFAAARPEIAARDSSGPYA